MWLTRKCAKCGWEGATSRSKLSQGTAVGYVFFAIGAVLGEGLGWWKLDDLFHAAGTAGAIAIALAAIFVYRTLPGLLIRFDRCPSCGDEFVDATP